MYFTYFPPLKLSPLLRQRYNIMTGYRPVIQPSTIIEPSTVVDPSTVIEPSTIIEQWMVL